MSDPHAFNWSEVADDIVVRQQSEIAVYANPDGAIVIRMAGHYGIDEDMWVVFQPAHAQAVAEAIMATATAIEADTQTAPARRDRTAAARQKRYRDRHAVTRDAVTDDRDGNGRG